MRIDKQKQRKKKKSLLNRLGSVSFWIIMAMVFFGIGFITGMIQQQILITKEIGLALSNANIEVNINMNETKIVDYTMQKFNETILPQITKGVLK